MSRTHLSTGLLSAIQLQGKLADLLLDLSLETRKSY